MAIAVFDRVIVVDLVRLTDLVIDFVKGLVVAIAVFDLVIVVDLVRLTDLVIDFVKGLVVAIADLVTV